MKTCNPFPKMIPAFLLVLSVTFSGCKEEPEVNTTIAGQWKLTDFTVTPLAAADTSLLDLYLVIASAVNEDGSQNVVYDFRSDGLIDLKEPMAGGPTGSGQEVLDLAASRWSVQGDQVVLDYGNMKNSFALHVDKELMQWAWQQDGYRFTLVYNRARQSQRGNGQTAQVPESAGFLF
jgi:hypothetical protein